MLRETVSSQHFLSFGGVDPDFFLALAQGDTEDAPYGADFEEAESDEDRFDKSGGLVPKARERLIDANEVGVEHAIIPSLYPARSVRIQADDVQQCLDHP